MSGRPNTDRAIAEWLDDEAAAAAPERLLAAIRTTVESTNQRRAWWPVRRFQPMNMTARFLGAIAAVAVVAVVAALAWPKAGGGPGGRATVSPPPSATAEPPSASPARAPSATPLALHDGALVAGTYTGNPFGTIRWTVTVPSGFGGAGEAGLIPTAIGLRAPRGMGLAILDAGNVYSDPCHGRTGDVVVGPSVDDLVNAIDAQAAYVSSSPSAIAIGGRPAKQIDVQVPKAVDLTKCTSNGGDPSVPAGSGGWFIWESRQAGGFNLYAQGPEVRFHVRAVDVAGTRTVVLTQDYAGTSAADVTTMQAIIDSIQFTP